MALWEWDWDDRLIASKPGSEAHFRLIWPMDRFRSAIAKGRHHERTVPNVLHNNVRI